MAQVNLLRKEGAGRAFLLLKEQGMYGEISEALCGALRGTSTVLLVECAQVGDANWQSIADEVAAMVCSEKLKQVSLVAFGLATSIAQNLCLLQPRLVRSMVLFDVCTRPCADWVNQSIDWLEKKLPMGLPFRSRVRGFDGRPFLQRLRCPVLVVSTPGASAHECEQSRLTAESLPTSWIYQAVGEEGKGVEGYCSLVLDFEQVPARCPQ